MFFILSQVWDKEIKIKNSIKYNSIQYFIQEIQIIITTEIPLGNHEVISICDNSHK